MVVDTNAVPDPGTVVVVARHAAVTYPTVLRSKRFSCHAVDAKCLTIKAAFSCKVLDDLRRVEYVSYMLLSGVTHRFQLCVACGLRASAGVKSDRAEEVVRTDAKGKREDKMGERV
jgi:hypothetical protein